MVIEEYKTIRTNLIGKVNKDITGFLETDNEYYYAVGQCISFMANRYVHLNKHLKKDLVSKDLMLSKDNTSLKEKLKNWLTNKCSNIIYMEDKKFNNAFAMLMGYAPNSNIINRDCLQLGYLENNIL